MRIKSSLIAFMGIIALLLVPMYNINYRQQDYLDIVTKSFQVLNAEFDALNMQGWAQISKKGLNEEELQEIYSQITTTLKIPDNPTITTEYEDFTSFYQKEVINSNTVLEISLQSFASQGHESGVFLGIQVLSSQLKGNRQYYEAISQIFTNLNIQTDIGVTIVGKFDNYLSPIDRYNTVAKIFNMTNALFVEGINTEQLISYSGYTKNCQDFIKVNGKKINLNIALRYHELDQKTYIHIGAPLIYQEY